MMKEDTEAKKAAVVESAPEETKYERVVKYVKDRIADGDLKIGDKLPTERELSEMLGTSRNCVREALRTLDSMGIISCRQGSGNYLTGDMQKVIEELIYMMSILNQIDDKDVCQLRRGIDVIAMKLAVQNFTEDKREEVEQLLSRVSEAEEEKATFIDKEVHMLISKYSNNKLIELINNSLSITMEKFIFKARKTVIENEGDVLTALHKEMLVSILERDEERGVIAINRHYDAMDKYL